VKRGKEARREGSKINQRHRGKKRVRSPHPGPLPSEWEREEDEDEERPSPRPSPIRPPKWEREEEAQDGQSMAPRSRPDAPKRRVGAPGVGEKKDPLRPLRGHLPRQDGGGGKRKK